jgi:hypothetical protein
MNTQQKFKIIEGFDHFNQTPLYQVSGINNEYVGEWSTDHEESKTELNNLNKN